MLFQWSRAEGVKKWKLLIQKCCCMFTLEVGFGQQAVQGALHSNENLMAKVGDSIFLAVSQEGADVGGNSWVWLSALGAAGAALCELCWKLEIGLLFPEEAGPTDLSRSLLTELLPEPQNNQFRMNRKSNPGSAG